MDIILILSTWIHILSAAIIVGGIFFLRIVVLKYAKREGGLSDELQKLFVKRYLHTTFGFLLIMLITGLFNFTQKNDIYKADEDGFSPHGIFGIKFIFFVIFAVLMGLAASSKKNEKRQNLMLLIGMILGIIIIFMSSWLSNSY